MTREEKMKIKSKKRKIQRLMAILILSIAAFFLIIGIVFTVKYFLKNAGLSLSKPEELEIRPAPLVGVAQKFPDLPITENFLTINEYSRPGTNIYNINYIVIHYTGNPGSTGEANRNYFESLKDSAETYASSQFVIGLDGEIIQCVPLNEIAYASNEYNIQSISIEMCHPDETGNFTDATYNNCVYLVAKLLDYYELDTSAVIRHYDVTGKECPKYFVDHEDRWQVFLDFVEQHRKK